MKRVWISTMVLGVLAGCGPGVIGDARDDHGPEVTVGGDALKTSFAQGDGWYTSPVLELEAPASRVAAMWTAAEVGRSIVLEARGIGEDGEAGPWRPLEVIFSEEELGVARVELALEARRVQLRVPEANAEDIALLTWTGARPELADSEDFGQSRLGLAADLANAGILPRSAWGARGARCGSADRAKVRMAVHHSVTARTRSGSYEAALRQIQSFHMDGRGYCDVGYHFFVTADGRVWEARNVDHVGGHSGNYNGGNIGIVFVGCFDASGACNGLGGTDAPDAMMAGAARAIAALSARHGIPINADRIKGHGEQPYQQTACPGNVLRGRLEELRSRARGTASPPPPPAAPPAPPSRSCGGLGSNEALARGSEMRSCNGLYQLVHQTDGNVVLYNTWSGTPVFATGTHGRATELLVMQGDGNLVLYGAGRALWASGTHGVHGATLAVQDDGNTVIYAPGARAVWATDTVGAGGTPPPPRPAGPCGAIGSGGALAPDQSMPSCDGRYLFVHQSDGNVVLYNRSTNRAVWSTGTHGRATSTLVMQGDGNLVLYAPGGRPLWASSTHGNTGAVLAVQDDGNVVVYTPSGRPLWATGTVGR